MGLVRAMEDLKPGRELDALIAEKVMGWKFNPGKVWIRPGGPAPFEDVYKTQPPEYSTDISAAWEVVKKLKHLHPQISYCDTTCQWTLRFNNINKEISEFSDIDGDSTAPHAICLAALKAVGYEG